MLRLSKLIEKLEDRLEPKVAPWYERHKKRLPIYAAVGLVGWYFYGMFLNSLRLGTAATFHKAGDEVVESIWVFNPFRNWFVVLTPFGLGATAVIALLVCLFTGTGYKWFSGYKATRDSRGFIIPFLMGCAQRKESVFITDPKGSSLKSCPPVSRSTGTTSRR